MKDLIHLDLFSGCGAFNKGFRDAGYTFKKQYFSEIDKHAIANYRYNFTNAEYVGSVTDVQLTERPNIITFGSPCQDFSLAGKRKGLEGGRSSLISYAIGLIERFRPDVFIWENVKGAFSSNAGADFWAIIQAFTNIGGYRLEWQLVNTAWFLPQNRERIYLIGHLADGCGEQVFPIGEDGKLVINAQRKKRFDIANTLTSSEYKVNCDTNYVRPISSPDIKEKQQNGQRIKKSGEDMFTLTSRDRHGVVIEQEIRRLTEIECERLQGLPDNWTKLGMYDVKGELIKKEVSSTQRYKMLGNAVTATVVQKIAERINLFN